MNEAVTREIASLNRKCDEACKELEFDAAIRIQEIISLAREQLLEEQWEG